MTIAVACNLADGVVMGVDSAITIHGKFGEQSGVLKVYEDAEKMFRLHKVPVGIATYGLAQLDLRTIKSYIREFEHQHEESRVKDWSIEQIADELWSFFNGKYRECFEKPLQEEHGKSFDEIPPAQKPVLGLIVGGFGPEEYLSELWDVMVHGSTLDDSVKQTRKPGEFGSSWRGQIEGVRRFHKGFSFQHLDAVIEKTLDYFGVEMEPALHEQISQVIQSAEYVIPWGGMPLQEGIDYVKFCLEVMINQTRFVVGAPTCAGNIRIGVVRREEGFQFVTPTELEVRTK